MHFSHFWDRPVPIFSDVRLIRSYIRSWERPGDLPQVIEILCLFASGAQRNERKETQIAITCGRSPGLSQERM
jgi:hypothetical protein